MNLNDLKLFVCTADCGSISRAAEQLNMTPAAASAGLKRLEKLLEAELFIRSTRRLRITAEGERFLVYCREALTSLDTGRAAMLALEGKIAGELRVSAPSDLGRNLLLGWIDEIMTLHPELSIHLMLGDSITDFYLNRVDLAIRYGSPKNSSLVAFKLTRIDRILCASPDYLATFGTPQKLADLTKHNCLIFELNSRPDDLWEFIPEKSDTTTRKNEPIKVKVTGNRGANDADVVRRWTVAGKGIAYHSRVDMSTEFRAGTLIRVLPQYRSPRIDLNLLIPGRKQITPAILLLRDSLRQKLAQQL